MIIRKAKIEDAKKIAEIHIQGWQYAYKKIMPEEFLNSISLEKKISTWKKLLTENQSTVFVAEEDNEVIGFSGFGPSRDEDSNPKTTGEFYAIYLDPNYIGQGIGKNLWLENKKKMKERGYSDCVVWVFSENQSAIEFYKCAGFGKDGNKEKLYEKQSFTLNTVRYRRSL